MSARVGVTLSDRYRLQRLIATGGMGQVWEGMDTRLGRQVAIKVLKAEFSTDPEFVERFRAEARIVAMLNHPGIASVYDYGETELDDAGRTAYLVMEMVNGEPLNSVLKRTGRLSLRHALDMLEQTGRALQVAHTAGLVHRDVKPGNILITPTGPGEAHRLRHRQGRRRRARHPDRHGHGHRPVHRARTGARPRRDRRQRRVLPGSRWLRVGCGPPPLHRRRRPDGGDEAHQGAAGPAARGHPAQRPRAHRDQPAQGARPAVSHRAARSPTPSPPCARAGARRDPTTPRRSAGPPPPPFRRPRRRGAAADYGAPADMRTSRTRPPTGSHRTPRRSAPSPPVSARCCGRRACSARSRSSLRS